MLNLLKLAVDVVAPFDPSEDERLVERIVVAGDRSAAELFYKRHVRAVTGMVRRFIGDRSDAEEIVQETFLEVFDKLGTLREPRAARAWVLRVAISKIDRRTRKSKLLAWMRLRPARHREFEFGEVAAPGLSPEEKLELKRFEEVLRDVPSSSRIPWMLRYVEGERLEDIAEICDCSVATVKRRIAAVDELVLRRIGKEGGAR